MGTKAGLTDARYDLQRVWIRLPANGQLASRTALKLGWARCIQMVLPTGGPANAPLMPVIPSTLPSSPSAQCTLASALAVEESSLDLLRSIRFPDSSSLSPAQTLHALYILDRSSLISTHLAEVLYASKNPPSRSTKWLSLAAQSSEPVALALVGLPTSHPKAPGPKVLHPPSPIHHYFPRIPTCQSLLWDARCSAADIWNLLGTLHENKGDANLLQTALHCYERALGWARRVKTGERNLES
ncbi:hypothetical protein V8E53_004756, partial [Lactarius tabidus]